MIDDRLADELERIGVEGRASILAEFAASSRSRLRQHSCGPWPEWSGHSARRQLATRSALSLLVSSRPPGPSDVVL